VFLLSCFDSYGSLDRRVVLRKFGRWVLLDELSGNLVGGDCLEVLGVRGASGDLEEC
jgi:hypothetical protein